MNAYTIACTTVLMAAGTLADRFGRKRVYVIGTVLFGATSLLCGPHRTCRCSSRAGCCRAPAAARC